MNGLTFSLVSSSFSDFFILDASTGVLRVKDGGIDFESRSSYRLNVRVQDPQGLSTVGVVNVRVVDINEPPVVMSGVNALNIREDAPAGSIVGDVGCVDPEGDILTMTVLTDSLRSLFGIRNQSIVLLTATLDYETTRSYRLRVRCVENFRSPPLQVEYDVNINILDVNEAPIAVTQSRFIVENSRPKTPVGLPLVASDPDAGQSVRFSIGSGNDLGLFAIEASTGQLTVDVGRPDRFIGCFWSIDTESSVVLQTVDLLQVSSAISTCSEQCARFQLFAIRASSQCWCLNRVSVASPTDNVACDQMCNGDSTASCGGTSAFAVYRRRQNLNFEQQSSYTLVVRATDSWTPALFTDFNVTVNVGDVNEPPILTLRPLSMVENALLSINASTFVTVSDEDIGDSFVMEQIRCVPQPCPFRFDPKSQVLINTAMLDYETITTYSLRFRATDRGSLAAEAETILSVINIKEPPIVTPTSRIVHENAQMGALIGVPVVGYDPDSAGGPVQFSITSQDNAGCVQIDSTTGQLSVARRECFDYESLPFDPMLSPLFAPVRLAGGSCPVGATGVQVTSERQNTSFVTISVSFKCVVFTTLADYDVGTFLSSISARVSTPTQPAKTSTIPLSFTIDAVNKSTVALLFELPLLRDDRFVELRYGSNPWTTVFAAQDLCKSLRAVVRVSDRSPVPLFAEAIVTVRVLDVNEPPSYIGGSDAFHVSENSPGDTLVGPRVSTLFFDPEGRDLVFAITSQTLPSAFIYDALLDQVRVGPSVSLNFEALAAHQVTVQVRDRNITTETVITISILDVNDAPVPFCSRWRASEAVPPRTVLDDAIVVVDEDAGDKMFTYRLLNGTDTFSIDNNGRLMTLAALDYETRPRYVFTVEVKDPRGATGSCVATLDVLDVNEPPVGPTTYNGTWHTLTPLTAPIVKIGLEDPERQTLSYRFRKTPPLSTSGKPLYGVTASGIVTLNASDALDTTPPAVAILEIIVSDGVYDVPVTCIVFYVEDAPPIRCPPSPVELQAVENIVGVSIGFARVVFTDARAAASPLVFELASSLSPFTMNATTGELLVDASKGGLDFERQRMYDLAFDATSTRFQRKITCQFRVRVIDQDEPPSCIQLDVAVVENQIGTNVAIGQLQATDPERRPLTFSIDPQRWPAAAARFAVTATGKVLSRDLSLLNHEAVALFRFDASVSDGVNTARCPVEITIDDANDCPSVLPQIRTILENSSPGSLVGSPVNVLDEDYIAIPSSLGRLRFEMTSDVFGIHATTGQLRVVKSEALNFENQSQFVVNITVTDDGNPACSVTAPIVVQVGDVNEPPVIVGGLSGSVLEFTDNGGQNASSPILRVIASDPDRNDMLRFALLSGNNSDLFRLDSRSGDLYVVAPSVVDFEKVSSYNLQVMVTDSGGLSTTADLTVTVQDVNEAPVFAQVSATVPESAGDGYVVIDSSASPIATDPEGDPSMTFTIVSASSTFAFDSQRRLVVNASNALDFEKQTRYKITVQACDSSNVCSSALINIQVNDVNEAPTLQSTSRSVAENAVAGTPIGSPLVASDPDIGQRLTFSITGGNEQEIFEIQSCSGQLFVRRSSVLDYETTSSYAVTVTVQDNGEPSLSASASVQILVRDVNESPLLVSDPSIRLSARPITSLSNSTIQAKGLRLVDVWTSSKDVFCASDVDSLERVTLSSACADIELTDAYSYQMTWQLVLLEPSSVAIRTLSNVENRVSIIVDGLSISINETFRPSIDLPHVDTAFIESPLHRGAHQIAVYVSTVTRGGDTIRVEIQLGNASWKPVSTELLIAAFPSTVEREIQENSPNATLVGAPILGVDSDTVDLSALRYNLIAQENPGQFALDGVTGQLILRGTVDYERARSHRVLVSVTDSGLLKAQVWVTVFVIDVNEPPTFPTLPRASSLVVLENANAGTLVGDPLVPVDPEGAYQSFRFNVLSIGSPFLIGETSGQLFVAPGTALDFETRTSHIVSIQATDLDGLSANVSLVVSVTDVNEAPTMEFDVLDVTENAPRGAILALLRGFDPENQTLSWSIVSMTLPQRSAVADVGDTTAFRVVSTSKSTAQLEVRAAAINYEVSSSFDVCVRVTDAGPDALSATRSFSVRVIDVNEPPRVAVSSLRYSIPENTANGAAIAALGGSSDVPAVVTDEDFDDTLTFMLQRASPRNGILTVSPIGQILVADSSSLDYEAIQVIDLVVQVRDKGNNVVSFDVTIDVTDVNEPPVFMTDSVNLTVSETVSAGTILHRVSAMDPEQRVIVYQAVSESHPGTFVVGADGTVQVVASELLPAVQYQISVRAQDNGGQGLVSPTYQLIRIKSSRVNRPPQVMDASFSVLENTTFPTRIGQVVATDSYNGSVLSFSLAPESTLVAVRASSTRTADVILLGPLDFETLPLVNLTICATDDGAANDYVDVMKGCGTLLIKVVDVNEPPEFDKKTCNALRSVVETQTMRIGGMLF
ncbi:hypothetical protein PINS_up010824 [Pythium insidiosum]|nr:hypothetical protein PINS_up010824 [Pythium insidiosum]